MTAIPETMPPLHQGRAHGMSGGVTDDDAWALRCTSAMAAGDRSAYEQLFLARCGFVEAEAARRLGTRRDLAEDAAQEAWIRVARRPRRCNGVADLDA